MSGVASVLIVSNKCSVRPKLLTTDICRHQSAASEEAMSASNYALPQYINPQHTDKMYNDQQLEQCFSTPRAADGLPSPCLTTPTSNTRGLTLELSDAATYVSEPSSASSMGSSPGYLTPYSSSNASSRRHSLIIPDSQQYFISGQTSPTPGPRRTRARHHNDHSPLAGSFSSYSESPCSGSTSFGSESFHSAVPENDILMGVDMYQNKPHIDWQYANNTISNQHHHAYDQGLQLNVPLSMDLAAGFDASMSGQMSDMPRHSDENPSMASFHTTTAPSRHRLIIPSQTTSFQQTHAPTLAEPFEPLSHLSDRSSRSPSPAFSSSVKHHRGRQGTSSLRRSKVSKKSGPKWNTPVIQHTNNNSHRCGQCSLAFKRPEHLKRHERNTCLQRRPTCFPASSPIAPGKSKTAPTT